MAEPEEQSPPAAAQSGSRSDGGEEAPEGGAAAGAAEPGPPPAGSPSTEEAAGDAKKKIDVLLKAVGDTPIMKTKKWAVERTRTIQGLVDFIKKFLKLMASEQLVRTGAGREVRAEPALSDAAKALLESRLQLPLGNLE